MINRIFRPFVLYPRTYKEIFQIFKTVPVKPIEKCSFRTPEHGFVSFYILKYKGIIWVPDLILKFCTINTEHILPYIINYLFIFWLSISLFIVTTIVTSILIRKPPFGLIKIALISQKKICDFLHINQYVFLFLCYIFIYYFNNLLTRLNDVFISYPFLYKEGESFDDTIILYRYFPSIWYTLGIPKVVLNFLKENRSEILNYLTLTIPNIEFIK
uniref:Uncharacterized protein n=1 Tax=Nitzschia putrida TaxID=2742595 RepID=A0A7R7TR34_9STRA|nr:hypothetical protein Ycf89 [Nitzschia putrida]BCQ06592.1 hypothetical protein Ycf89 [Nitzschia putrida]